MMASQSNDWIGRDIVGGRYHLEINNSQPAEVSHWLEDVCKALDFVHTRNFLHRDIAVGRRGWSTVATNDQRPRGGAL
jgi:serine/threonine protein kinase